MSHWPDNVWWLARRLNFRRLPKAKQHQNEKRHRDPPLSLDDKRCVDCSQKPCQSASIAVQDAVCIFICGRHAPMAVGHVYLPLHVFCSVLRFRDEAAERDACFRLVWPNLGGVFSPPSGKPFAEPLPAVEQRFQHKKPDRQHDTVFARLNEPGMNTKHSLRMQ